METLLKASEADWAVAKRRQRILSKLAESKECSRAVMQKACAALQLSRAMVFRALARYREDLMLELGSQGNPRNIILQVVCDLLWLLTRAIDAEFHIHHRLESSHFRPHYRWERPPSASPWLGDLRMRDRRSVLATAALMMLDSDLNRRHLHHPGRLFLPGMGILHRLLTQED